jgi:hypothetical protein
MQNNLEAFMSFLTGSSGPLKILEADFKFEIAPISN